MSLSGAGKRIKGHQWERDVAKRFREVFTNYNVRRGVQSRDPETADVDIPAFWCECKVGAKPNPRAALAQAIRDCKKGKTPIAVIKDDRKQPTVFMLFEDFLDLIGEWWELKTQ